MMFLKENLLEDAYSWTSSAGKPDQFPTRMRFDRFNGDCVVRMINLFNILVMNVSILEGQTIEKLLQNELPLQANSEITVFNWLKTRYAQKQEKLI